MKILVVEDDPSFVEIFETELTHPEFDLTVARSRASAMEALSQSFELVVCDLKLPPEDEGFDSDTAHGMAVLSEVVRSFPGTPVIVFSAFGTVAVLQEIMSQGRHGDYLGIGEQREMLVFLQKDELTKCLDEIRNLARSFGDLSDIELATDGVAIVLEPDEKRVIRLLCRRLGGTLVHVKALDGGKSGSRVLGLRIDSSSGHVATVVAKVDALARIQDERRRIETYVVGALPLGVFPAIGSVVEEGAGAMGGLLFQIAGYDNHVLDVILGDPTVLGPCIDQLAIDLQGWREGTGVDRHSVRSIREAIVDSSNLNTLQQAAIDDSVENIRVHTRTCIQHGDLHVFNVLTSPEGKAIVIDFANVRPAPAAFDPVTLELSVAFHESAREQYSAWPSPEAIHNWSNLDLYLAECPYPDFVRACRRWAHTAAGGDGEVWACAYSYGIAQLRFTACPQPLAEALIGGVVANLRSLGH